ncbi:hypothetical protein RCL1_003779 [Eukaryota sp. TZLM3-RCL]
MTSKAKAIAIPGMLGFGTCTVVIQKIIFGMKGEGRPGSAPHTFRKPWFQTNAMFLGMFWCLIVFELQRLFGKKKKQQEEDQLLITTDSHSIQQDAPKKKSSHLMYYLVVGAPAMFDLVATILMNIGLLFIAPSIWQMLRGSMTIFSALLSKYILGKALPRYKWFSVVIVSTALFIVAASSVLGPADPGSQRGGVTPALTLLGVCLTVGAQVIQASQIVCEEKILKHMNAPPVLIVGLEGLYGIVVGSGLLFLVATFPKHGFFGHFHEDTIDTFYMLKNNPQIGALGILYTLVILGYNLYGMFVTNLFNAVYRTILEGLRCGCIWAVNLLIHYTISDSFGEAWSPWSFLQLFGFCVLLLGMFVNSAVVKVPGFLYPEDVQKTKPRTDEVAV